RGERKGRLVQQLPGRLPGGEQCLELGAQRDGETGGEGGAPAAVELRDGAAELTLQARATRRRQGAGGDGVSDDGNKRFGHFMSHQALMTNYVIIYRCDKNCQLLLTGADRKSVV